MSNRKCQICKLNIAGDNVNCVKCQKSYHFKCTTLTVYEIQAHKRNKYKPWKCQVCINKFCNNCNKTFTPTKLNSICCDHCLQ